MRRSILNPLFAVITLAYFVAIVRAGAISGTFSGDATLTPSGTPGVYVQNFTGDGDDTTFGALTSQSQSTVDFSKPPTLTISDGSLTETFAQGSLIGTSSGSGTANGTGTATFTIDFVITGGTKAFAGDTGEVTLTGTITTTSATTESISNGTYAGSITPEPVSLCVLGIGSLGLLVRRRRD